MGETVLTIRRGNSMGADAWRRLRQNKMAMLSLIILVIMILCALFAKWVAPYGYDQQNLNETFLYPSLKHLFGTDNLGRDIFSRVIYGSRISLSVGLIAVGIAVVIGGTLGAISGFYSKTDNIIMRFMDIFMAIPSLLMALAITTALGSGTRNLMIAVGISSMPQYARILRASVLTVKDQEYVEAARSSGASNLRIIVRYILPNAFAPLLVQATLGVGNAIMSAATLSFLGLGVQPPTPEWGSLLSTGRNFIRQFWPMTIFPGIAIMVVVYSLNILGDGLRDALDPKLKN
jgi:peptide/nickel transport system permease protein